MPNAATTQTSSASQTTGTPVPLGYGYQWVTGKRLEYYMLQDTGDSWMDFTRLGLWALGHGEWDGCEELWINDILAWNGDVPADPPDGFGGQNWVKAADGGNPLVFNFHRGTDAIIGGGLAPSSSGPDQGVDVLFAQFPPAINPLCYSRIAYYGLMRKQAIPNQTNNHRNDPSQWTDLNPIGLWRGLRCRLFDDQGNVTGYAFTTNPAWHFVDVLLRRKIFPDYMLDLINGPQDLSDAVRNRFDWGTIFQSAQYFDQILANGRRRFTGNYGFAQQTSLQAVLEQILLCCRSFMREYGGKISLVCDAPRSSVFTFSRQHILPGSWEANDQKLHTTANRFIANFRDLLVPQAAAIASITCADHGKPEVTTEKPHPFAKGDRIALGGTGTVYDGQWAIDSVPPATNVGTPEENDPTTFVMVAKGSNYPTSVGAGGGVGLLYSRFKERSPEFWHKRNMLARGVVGLGIPLQRNKVKQALDFATSTWDQASRLTCYERDRLLGLDVTPYITPPQVRFKTSMFARDAFGNLACAIQPGDRVTLDDTTNFLYAGEYEVLDPLTIRPPSAKAAGEGNSISLAAEESSGEIELALGPYNEAVMYDSSDPSQAGWPSVSGSDPGNDSNYTTAALAAGTLAFFTGSMPSGQAFNLPSTGYSASNLFCWASPQGYLEKGHPMHVIQTCDADSTTRQLTLNYEDGEGNIWNGDVNYAGLSWLSTDAPTFSNGLNWIEFTLSGGEKVIFGRGVVEDGTTLVLPSPYTLAQAFAVAYPHDGNPTGNDAHGVAAFVDSSLVAHLNYQDGEGHVWHGDVNVLVFAWRNNMGTVTTETLSGGNWMQCPLADGTIFGAGCALGLGNGAAFSIPSAAGNGSTLQAIAGPSAFAIVDHPAHGVGACYLDGDLVLHLQFEDGEGHVWYGNADVFALYCQPSTAEPTQVTVAPLSASLAAGSIQQFVATVQFNADHAIAWSVDGILGGNVAVGTIDASGYYSAPSTGGMHTITATSVASPSASGSAAVAIFGTILPGGSVLTDSDGNIIYLNGDVIYVE